MEWVYHNLEEKEEKLNNNGYLEVYYPEHPHAVGGWILKHRMVMENFVGYYLDPEVDVVHHVNEVKTCNYIWNLFLTTAEEHTLIHRLGHKHKKSTKKSMSKAHKTAHKKRQRGIDGRFQ